VIEFYPQIKLVHIACVVASGSIFAVRGLLVLSGSPFGNHALLRVPSYAIDTLLLAAAFLLMSLLHAWPGAQAWLTVKVLLVLVYIVLGSFALKRGRTPAVRRACFLAALTVFLFVVGIARRHDPLGVLRGLAGAG
jgi:uncharacterized membrane protein SirB2